MYGGVRGRKTKVGRKLLRFPPTRLNLRLDSETINMSIHQHNDEKGGRPPPATRKARRKGRKFSERGENKCFDAQKF